MLYVYGIIYFLVGLLLGLGSWESSTLSESYYQKEEGVKPLVIVTYAFLWPVSFAIVFGGILVVVVVGFFWLIIKGFLSLFKK